MKKYKVLVASMLAGSGHNSAGDLFYEVLKNDDRFEVIRFISPTKYVDSHYNKVTKYFPSIYNLFVKYSPTLLSDIVTVYVFRLVDECVEVLRKEKPDILIGTHFSQIQCFRVAQRVLNKYPLTYETFLDYGEQSAAEVPFNVYLRADYNIAFDEVAYEFLVNKMRGNRKHFLFGGHRARGEFRDTYIKYKGKALEALCEKFKDPPYDKIGKDKVTVLITSGGGGSVQRTLKLLKRIARAQKHNIELINKYQFFIICGSNKGFLNKVLKLRNTKLSWQNFFPFGWLNPSDYALVQCASDFPVLYSIAPATMHELMETRCGPIFVHKLRGSHEKGNAMYLVDNDIGEYVLRMDELIMKIFKGIDKHRKEKFEQAVDKLLELEDHRLTEFPDIIYDQINQKRLPKIRDIYKVSFWYQVSSILLMFLFLNLYNIFRFKNFIKSTIRRFKHFIKKLGTR